MHSATAVATPPGGTTALPGLPPERAAYELGKMAEGRRSPRRRTIAQVRIVAGPAIEPDAVATDLSADGAFIRTAARIEPGTRLKLELTLPTEGRPIPAAAHVVRASAAGIGVRLEEVSARDRSRLRSHAGFYETDEAIARVQRALGDVIPGNLLPLGERSEIEAIIAVAHARRLPITVVHAGRAPARGTATIAALEGDGSEGVEALRLADLQPALAPDHRVVYLAFSEPPLHYAFEGIVVEGGASPAIIFPDRIYMTERRTGRRAPRSGGWCVLEAPSSENGRIRLPVLDVSDTGASICLERTAVLVPGMHLPAFMLELDGDRKRVPGASVRYVTPIDGWTQRAGLRFDEVEGARDRETFKEAKRRPVDRARGPLASLKRGMSVLSTGLQRLIGKTRTGRRSADIDEVEVVRFRNRRGSTVVGIVDANYDTSDPAMRPDAAIVIAPAFLKRKEVFALMARTILDDLGRDGRKIVVLRFDASHTVGESSIDPKLAAEGRPYFRWSYDDLAADMEGSLAYVERRFQPTRRVLVSVSISAIPARKVVAGAKSPVDLWVAPYGCPDAQDMLKNYLAGLDLFEIYQKGEKAQPLLIHGRPMDPDVLYGQAIADKMAYLEDARRDLSRIQVPVVWALGDYDCWVTRSRVKAMLEAPGGGIREIFQIPTGHVMKSGAEAIETFKLVSESISKHLFASDRPARDPDLGKFARQNDAEWARVKKMELADAEGFWQAHLFGSPGDEIGYDVLLEHPDYRDFMATEAALLDPQPGEHIADVGCGTGNFISAMLDTYKGDAAPASVTLLDLVPEAVTCTEGKVAAHFAARKVNQPQTYGRVVDLEVSRLGVVQAFLDGKLHGVEALAGRVEGLSRPTARKLARGYGKELHGILRGEPTSEDRIRAILPDLDDDEVEIVLELGRAARFLLWKTVADDLADGFRGVPNTARDLKFRHLRFAAATRSIYLDLPSGAYDRIGSSLCISYLYDPLTTLKEIHRILKPGGTFVVSSMVPDFDPSKLYTEEAAILARNGDEMSTRKLNALRKFASMVGKLIELEEDGRFKFYDGAGLTALLEEAGFTDIEVQAGFGIPPTAVIARCRKRCHSA